MASYVNAVIWTVCCFSLFFTNASCYGQPTERAHYLGREVKSFELDLPISSSSWDLYEETKRATGTVIYFMATECPVNNLYVPVVNQLAAKYATQGIRFVGINSNGNDTESEIAEHIKKFSVSFPVLKDTGGLIAKQLGATRTTEVLVLDSKHRICFRGRVDDRYERGVLRPKTGNHYLTDALDAILTDHPISTPITDVIGCPINFGPSESNRLAPDNAESKSSVTFTKEVSRIIQSRCESCHHAGDIGPFPLTTYQDAVDWAASIREVVTEGLMPPWNAEGSRGEFSNDRRLTSLEYKTLLDWIDNECVEGDEADLPEPIAYDHDWDIENPSLILKMNRSFEVPAVTPEGGVPYRYAWGDHTFEEEQWIEAAEVNPGQREVVHHIIVYLATKEFIAESELDGTGEFMKRAIEQLQPLVSFVPGEQLLLLPEGLAKRVPKGGRLLFEIHYTPNGKATTDRSSIAIRFASKPPRHEVKDAIIVNARFKIPPYAANHEVKKSLRIDRDVMLLSLKPHMHYRGKSFNFELIEPDGTTKTLLSVPNYDFNWQTTYRLQEPLRILKGSVIKCTAIFDNSEENPFNPDPSVEVTWGEQSWEEMMLGYLEYYVP